MKSMGSIWYRITSKVIHIQFMTLDFTMCANVVMLEFNMRITDYNKNRKCQMNVFAT